VELALRFSL
jgi:hypothetical protein